LIDNGQGNLPKVLKSGKEIVLSSWVCGPCKKVH
jgi:hypothetical protein